jgi:hypothetical protein
MSRASLFAVALALACMSAVRTLGAADPASPTKQHIAGTIRRLDAQMRVIELMTGVGYATRLIRFRVADDARIEAPHAGALISSLTPGTYARVELVRGPATALAPDNLVAVAITVLIVEDGGGAP